MPIDRIGDGSGSQDAVAASTRWRNAFINFLDGNAGDLTGFLFGGKKNLVATACAVPILHVRSVAIRVVQSAAAILVRRRRECAAASAGGALGGSGMVISVAKTMTLVVRAGAGLMR